MVTAEKWYEYEENYRRHNLDMDLQTTQRVRAKTKTKKHLLSAKDRSRLVAYVLVLAIVCVGMVISGAYAATLKCSINGLIAENTEIQREIETLNVKIKTANNISAIEERALNELGMIYPEAGSIVYVMGEEGKATNFAMILKEQAYN